MFKDSNDFANIFLLSKLYKIEEALKLKKELERECYILEKNIIEVAVNFSKGEYLENEYIRSIEAYLITLNFIEKKNLTFDNITKIIENEIERKIQERNYNAEMLIAFTENFIEYLKNDKNYLKGMNCYDGFKKK